MLSGNSLQVQSWPPPWHLKLQGQSLCVCPLQANIDPALPPEERNLESLCNKMKQYCYLLADLTPELLQQECGSDYEAMRKYLRQRGVDAYWQKVGASARDWACSFFKQQGWLPAG